MSIYQKYKNTILFNKNLILSGIAAFFAGAIFTQLFAAFSISEIIYSVCKISVQYYSLQRNVEPYQATMMAAIFAWIVFLVCINTSIKAVKLFKKSSK